MSTVNNFFVPQRIEAGGEDIDPEIVLCVVDEVGFGDVMLDNQGPRFGDLGPFVHNLDSRAAGHLEQN